MANFFSFTPVRSGNLATAIIVLAILWPDTQPAAAGIPEPNNQGGAPGMQADPAPETGMYLSPTGLQAGSCGASLQRAGERDDVLVLVNRNSRSSCAVAEHYAAARGLGRNALLEVSVPASYFIDWEAFRSLRDQIIAHLAARTLSDPAAAAEPCVDGDSPYYCASRVDAIRGLTRIRYLVTTRGIPTRVTVTGSTLPYDEPTSVDNYLRHWLIHYFDADTPFYFPARAQAFTDGRGMRGVNPATDVELIVGRIDGLTETATKALVDRTLAAEAGGLFGKLYGSMFGMDAGVAAWRRYDQTDSLPIYGDDDTAWRLQPGLFGESRQECIDYLDHPANTAAGKAPVYCRARLTDGSDKGPSAPAGRQPTVPQALVYLGSRDNSRSATGNFSDLLEWRKTPDCQVKLCADSADPAACRAQSTDVYQEINTACVGVADGFIGFNLQSYPVSYLTAWPTNWRGPSGGSFADLAFPQLRSDDGYGDAVSVWFGNPDEVDDPRCFTPNDVTGTASDPCFAERRIWMRQIIDLPLQAVNVETPQQYRIGLWYATDDLAHSMELMLRLRVNGPGNEVVYPSISVATPDTGSATWQYAETTFSLEPGLHAGAAVQFDQLSVQLQSTHFAGALGIDAVTVTDLSSGVALAENGDFSDGHRSLSDGDHAAIFLSRLNGVAFWGSQSHHESSGFSFASHPVTSLVYFLRGLPLGDAVWFAEFHNSGILYGDPLYSPVAVRLDYHNAYDYITGDVEIRGSAVNGQDATLVSTTHTIDYCAGDDFFVCDRNDAWLPTGVAGSGGTGVLGVWDTAGIARGVYTLRLNVDSSALASGDTQRFNDYQVVTVYDASADDDSDGIANAVEIEVYGLDPSVADMDGDGLLDGDEIVFGLDPRDADSDDDGMPDGYEVDSGLDPTSDDALADNDSDGITNSDEYFYGTNAGLADTDGDWLPDAFELFHLGTDPTLADSDADGISDLFELAFVQTDPMDADTDGDAMPDGYEWLGGLAPLQRDALDDADGDGIDNVVEYLRGTDPFDAGEFPEPVDYFVDVAAPGGGDGSATQPFTLLGQALAAASAGDTIYLAPGRHPLNAAMTITRNVRIVGTADGVILDTQALTIQDLAWGGFERVHIETWLLVDIVKTRNWSFHNGSIRTGIGTFLRDDAQAVFSNVAFVTWGAIAGIELDTASELELRNVTIADFANGIAVSGEAARVRIFNSILDNSVDIVGDAAVAEIQYTLTGDPALAGGTGNLVGEPLFRNQWWGDFRLLPGSPGIDAGDPADDFSQEPAPNGCRINMGAFGDTANAAASVSC